MLDAQTASCLINYWTKYSSGNKSGHFMQNLKIKSYFIAKFKKIEETTTI